MTTNFTTDNHHISLFEGACGSFLVFFLLISNTAFAQTAISGRVQDEQFAPIAYATVSLLRSDSTLVTGAITDDNGAFVLSTSTGNYILQVSFVGYQTRCQTVKSGTKDLIITLREESQTLDEVEVKAKHQLIERQYDKIVLDVANSPFSVGYSSKELLKKAPGVNVDKDGNVTVNGKSVEVYIDGRPSNLSGDQLKAMLEGTDGSTIEKIEVITNPSAKYDAAGQCGIINIKTRRNMMKGLNGSLSVTYGGMWWKEIQQWHNTDIFSLNLNYRTDKTYTFGSITQLYQEQSNKTVTHNIIKDSTTNTTTERYDNEDAGANFQYYMLKVGNDWFIDKQNTLGFIFQAPIVLYNQQLTPNRGVGYTKANDTETSTSVNTSNMRVYSPRHTLNLNYTHVFNDSLSRELTVNLDYNRSNSRRASQQNSLNRYADKRDSLYSALTINTRQTVDVYSAKADFQTSFWNTGMIEAGAKWAMSNTFNRMTTDSVLNDYTSPTTRSDFDYSEQVAALYVSVAKQFGEHFNTKLGLRGEFTHSEGNWLSADSTTGRNYFDLFPTAFFGYNPTKDWSMDMSYTRRINRPSYWQLNPFRSYSSTHSYTEGNPDLKPSYTHQVNVNFGYSQYVSLGFDFSHTVDDDASQPEVLPNGDSRIRYVNFGTYTRHGVNLSLTELPLVPKFTTAADGSREIDGAWLALTLYAGYSHTITKAYDNSTNLKCHSGYGSATLTAYLPKDWTVAVDGMCEGPSIWGYYRNNGFYYMGASVRKQWKERGLILNLDVQDLLRSMKSTETALNQTEGCSSANYWEGRFSRVSLSLTWMFGQQQYVKHRNVGNIDEAARMGGGTGSSTGK